MKNQILIFGILFSIFSCSKPKTKQEIMVENIKAKETKEQIAYDGEANIKYDLMEFTPKENYKLTFWGTKECQDLTDSAQGLADNAVSEARSELITAYSLSSNRKTGPRKSDSLVNLATQVDEKKKLLEKAFQDKIYFAISQKSEGIVFRTYLMDTTTLLPVYEKVFLIDKGFKLIK